MKILVVREGKTQPQSKVICPWYVDDPPAEPRK